MLFNFDARYRQQFKTSFDYKTYGFNTLSDCLQSLPDVLEMIPTGTKTFKLMPIKTRVLTHILTQFFKTFLNLFFNSS